MILRGPSKHQGINMLFNNVQRAVKPPSPNHQQQRLTVLVCCDILLDVMVIRESVGSMHKTYFIGTNFNGSNKRRKQGGQH